MAHLTEQHAVFRIVDKVVSDVTTMGIVAGNTTHLAATSLLERIRLAAQGVAGSRGGPDNMGLVAEMTMAGQTQFINRFDQL